MAFKTTESAIVVGMALLLTLDWDRSGKKQTAMPGVELQ
jgi:hypothetical protein